MRRLVLTLCIAWPCTAVAQGPGLQVGHLFTDPPATSYRLGSSTTFFGPLGAAMHAAVVDGRSPMGNLWGAGLDLSLFRGGRTGLYLLGGFEGGLATRGQDTFWGSWSAGLGYEVFPFGGLSFAIEGRYRDISPGGFHGVEMSLRLALDGGSRRSGREARAAPSARTAPAAPAPVEVRTELGGTDLPEDRATLVGSVVQTALEAMGMPYRWGDEGETGFDCSGLIRYAFGRHGVAMPRRSVDQAREGQEVGRDLAVLRPGDVLTFATSGRRVSHVGLYIGNGKFIHSASQGVQISVLSAEDVSGRWWFQRWVGARRIVG